MGNEDHMPRQLRQPTLMQLLQPTLPLGPSASQNHQSSEPLSQLHSKMDTCFRPHSAAGFPTKPTKAAPPPSASVSSQLTRAMRSCKLDPAGSASPGAAGNSAPRAPGPGASPAAPPPPADAAAGAAWRAGLTGEVPTSGGAQRASGGSRGGGEGQPPRPITGIHFKAPPRRLDLELCSQPSQENMTCTPDQSTPVEQQFHFERDPGAPTSMTSDDEARRSPAPSPDRKRPRQFTNGNDSDTSQSSMQSQGCSQSTSQSQSQGLSQSQSQGGSQGGGGTCRKPVPAGSCRRPPVAPVAAKMVPPTLRNPYLCPHGTQSTNYTQVTPRPGPQQSRFGWEYLKEGADLGHGKYGIVFRALHKQQGRSYAIKRSKKPLMNPTEKNVWIAEIQALSLVEGHPNVTAIHDSWSEADPTGGRGEHMYIKMELCGDNLAVVLRATRKQSLAVAAAAAAAGLKCSAVTLPGLPDAQLNNIFKQMCAALQHIHGLGLVHLDLKPDNIYTTPGGVYKLGDFGLATAKDGACSGALEGDTRYLAPELLRNQYHQLDKADMFALGVSMYELASGRDVPTGGALYQALRSGDAPKLGPHVGAQLQEAIRRLMLGDPSQRPSADDLCRSALGRTRSIPLTRQHSPAAAAAAAAITVHDF